MKPSKDTGEGGKNSHQQFGRQVGVNGRSGRNRRALFLLIEDDMCGLWEGRKVLVILYAASSSSFRWTLLPSSSLPWKVEPQVRLGCVPPHPTKVELQIMHLPLSQLTWTLAATQVVGQAFLKLWWLTHAVNENDTNYCEETIPQELQPGPCP